MMVLDEWSTLIAVWNKDLSIARLGDGEAKLLRNASCKTQPFHVKLSDRLRGILSDPDPSVLVCIPRIFDADPPLNPSYWRSHIEQFARYGKRGYEYGSSFISRRDAWPIADEDAYWNLWRMIWADRPVLLVTGSQKGLAARQSLLGTAASVDVLNTPRPDAWSLFEELKESAEAWGAGKSNPCVVLACGATATVLAHDLGAAGIQALDLGHAAQAAARVNQKELAEA